MTCNPVDTKNFLGHRVLSFTSYFTRVTMQYNYGGPPLHPMSTAAQAMQHFMQHGDPGTLKIAADAMEASQHPKAPMYHRLLSAAWEKAKGAPENAKSAIKNFLGRLPAKAIAEAGSPKGPSSFMR